LESGAFALSWLLAFLMVIPTRVKICEKPQQIRKNPSKSDQIRLNQTSFFTQSEAPVRRGLGEGGKPGPPIGSSVTLVL
jgi:hypothetical protein